MRVRILVVIALVCGVAIAGCSRAPEPVPVPAPAVPAPAPTEDDLTAFYEQTIEWRDCAMPLKLPSLLSSVRVPRYFTHDFLQRTAHMVEHA